jgi:choloylglycine hydrolase
MCTAVSYRTTDHYFGRNLDLEYSYQEEITVTPRNYPFRFRHTEPFNRHHAMIGMATVIDGCPLYYEATNEKGLSIAGLNFPGNAVYLPIQSDKINIAPFELIPYLLGQCETVVQVETLLGKMNLANTPFSPQLSLTPLHWIISDKDRSIVVEPMADRLHIYENPVGVLTNNPPFDFHLYNLRNYLNVSAQPAVNRFSSQQELAPFSNGMGGIGLPGDYSSASRFVKATFVKMNSVAAETEDENVHQFFHILSSVEMPRGSVVIRPNEFEITLYSCCCNTDKGIYYYRTYGNSRITGIDLHRENLEGCVPVRYPLKKTEPIEIEN